MMILVKMVMWQIPMCPIFSLLSPLLFRLFPWFNVRETDFEILTT